MLTDIFTPIIPLHTRAVSTHSVRCSIEYRFVLMPHMTIVDTVADGLAMFALHKIIRKLFNTSARRPYLTNNRFKKLMEGMSLLELLVAGIRSWATTPLVWQSTSLQATLGGSGITTSGVGKHRLRGITIAAAMETLIAKALILVAAGSIPGIYHK